MANDRVCSTCGKTKPITEFGWTTRYGYSPQCKECKNIVRRRYLAKNRERVNRERRIRRRAGKAGPRWESRTVKMIYCPVDPELSVPMYPWPCYFPRMHFTETLAERYWPDGCIVEFALVYRGPKSLWRVGGQFIFEIGTERVAVAQFQPGEHVRVELVEAAVAAKGA